MFNRANINVGLMGFGSERHSVEKYKKEFSFSNTIHTILRIVKYLIYESILMSKIFHFFFSVYDQMKIGTRFSFSIFSWFLLNLLSQWNEIKFLRKKNNDFFFVLFHFRIHRVALMPRQNRSLVSPQIDRIYLKFHLWSIYYRHLYRLRR